jgi:hypothetical protein
MVMDMFFCLIFALNSISLAQKIDDYKKMLEQVLETHQAQFRDIRIERIDGSVRIITPDGMETDLNDNYQYPLESGDIIKTGYNGTAIVYIDNIAAINIDRNSEFEVSDNSNEPVFTLNFGSIISKVEKMLKQKFQFKIKTIQAVCAVRGTEFAIEHSKLTGESVFGVFDEGEIVVYPGEEEDETKAIRVSKNSEVVLSNQTKNQRVVRISRMLRYKNFLTNLRKKMIIHKKRWKRFKENERIKYRNMLFMKKKASVHKENFNNRIKDRKVKKQK